jgi:hypothetical protein
VGSTKDSIEFKPVISADEYTGSAARAGATCSARLQPASEPMPFIVIGYLVMPEDVHNHATD